MDLKFKNVKYFRNFIFGVEDSLVSTVGLLSGVAVAGIPETTILLTGIILLMVEGLSMAVGSFLTESSVEEYTHETANLSKKNILSGIVMFFSYFIAGFVPLAPYLVWPVDVALKFSAIFSVLALFGLGAVSARLSNVSIFRDGFRMAGLGGLAIAVGIIAGNVLTKIN